MWILVTGYEVLENGIIKVGKEFPVALMQVGEFIQENKDTYKQVYK